MPIKEAIEWCTPKEKEPPTDRYILVRVGAGDVRPAWCWNGKVFVGQHYDREIKRYSRWAYWPSGKDVG